ncbi:undecaprenyl-phosphate 4-deoxy-4-formamido-L-arabinose transferase [Mariprofundus micogutta]|uniref:Undecaprenyl-phosphate 4-deoxy-4-formamido-L-arabinose transferase n=1 Tax=Mariprofundus micogutta TaxID=1921010 RepID=A0A1L8CKK6_9PROT|nr:glycosyltransferase family 2 protein [Mariprofundus micogutta]GAV19444.1 undecaprenyl-phosphate 4-deoxy-4-formamido-L-arabinose transferase [Mariprofundus micogutta]
MAEALISIVVPLYEEEENVPLLVAEMADKLADIAYELILVDDGSDDGTVEAVKKARESDDRVVLIQLRRNFGQTAAMSAGFDRAQGKYVVYMDGDLQTDPADIPKLLERLKKDNLDMVNGWRKDRQDASVSRNLPSKIANALIRSSTNVRMHDYGCPMKLMRADVAKNLRIYGEQHRFLPALASLYGAKLGEEVVTHRARQFGESKYGIGRTVRVVVDLLLVLFFQRFTDRPLQLFGPAGLIALASGLFIDLWLTMDKLIFGADLAARPMLQLGSLLIVTGILLFGIGLMLEMQARTYYEATGRRHYSVRDEDE